MLEIEEIKKLKKLKFKYYLDYRDSITLITKEGNKFKILPHEHRKYKYILQYIDSKEENVIYDEFKCMHIDSVVERIKELTNEHTN